MEFKKYTKQIEINGNKIDVYLTVEVHEDEHGDPMDQDFESDAQREEYSRKFKDGELFLGGVILNARALGLEGTDSIWGCELVPNNYFSSKPFNQSVNDVLSTHSLEENALAQLKQSIETRYDALISEAEFYKAYRGSNK